MKVTGFLLALMFAYKALYIGKKIIALYAKNLSVEQCDATVKTLLCHLAHHPERNLLMFQRII